MNKILNWIDFECYDIKVVLADTDFTVPQVHNIYKTSTDNAQDKNK